MDLQAIATPPPVPEVVKSVLPPSGPAVGAGTFRAWVPGATAPNGDRSEGHWMTLSVTPPSTEVVEPTTPMPRVPKPYFGKTEKKKDEGAQTPMSPAPQWQAPQTMMPYQQGMPLRAPQGRNWMGGQ